jgi:hypothetical protein
MDMQILAVELAGQNKAPSFACDDKILTVPLPKPVGPKKLAGTFAASKGFVGIAAMFFGKQCLGIATNHWSVERGRVEIEYGQKSKKCPSNSPAQKLRMNPIRNARRG